jgi:aryl-alcohol dehydrogenase-like predicted oxidoreductase
VDYVDLVFCHRPDPLTPTETVVRAMTDIVRSGKATAWGTSEWSAQQITEAVWMARTYGLEPPQFEQPQYHMFHRERIETEYFPLFQQPYNLGRPSPLLFSFPPSYASIGLTIWSPLASGLLTGKYNDSIPDGSRLASSGYSWLQKTLQKWHDEGKIEKVRRLTAYAQENFQCSVGQLALAWCVKNKNVSTVLLGATKTNQLEENLGAIAVVEKITSAQMVEINEILGNNPEPYHGYNPQDIDGYRKLETI